MGSFALFYLGRLSVLFCWFFFLVDVVAWDFFFSFFGGCILMIFGFFSSDFCLLQVCGVT